MKLSKGHRNTKILVEEGLEYEIPQHLLKPFFDKIDKGIEPPPDLNNNLDFVEVLFSFRMLAWNYNQYVEDFKLGLLFLSDFEEDSLPRKELALRAYRAAGGL